MASGTPDYFRTVRQIYGAAHTEQNATLVVASVATPILDVSGKGIIYGGALLLDYTSTQKNSYPEIRIDGVELSVLTMIDLMKFSLVKDKSCPFYILHYDEKNFIYTVGIQPGMTFEVSFELIYNENHATTPFVLAWITYALL